MSDTFQCQTPKMDFLAFLFASYLYVENLAMCNHVQNTRKKLKAVQHSMTFFFSASGMSHLRAHNIVHRDIKPGNIMKYEDHENGR